MMEHTSGAEDRRAIFSQCIASSLSDDLKGRRGWWDGVGGHHDGLEGGGGVRPVRHARRSMVPASPPNICGRRASKPMAHGK